MAEVVTAPIANLTAKSGESAGQVQIGFVPTNNIISELNKLEESGFSITYKRNDDTHIITYTATKDNTRIIKSFDEYSILVNYNDQVKNTQFADLKYIEKDAFKVDEDSISSNTCKVKRSEYEEWTSLSLDCSIPSTITFNDQQYTIIGISDSGFQSSKIKSINFEKPDNITYLGESAFEGSRDLQEFNCPDNIKIIPKNCFLYTGIEKITFGQNSQLTGIEETAFYDCHYLEKIELPSKIRDIGHAAFSQCTMLNSISIPDGNTWYCIGNATAIDVSTPGDNALFLKDLSSEWSQNGISFSDSREFDESKFTVGDQPQVSTWTFTLMHFAGNVSVHSNKLGLSLTQTGATADLECHFEIVNDKGVCVGKTEKMTFYKETTIYNPTVSITNWLNINKDDKFTINCVVEQ